MHDEAEYSRKNHAKKKKKTNNPRRGKYKLMVMMMGTNI